MKVNVISASSSTTRILLYAARAVKSNSEVTCLGLFPALPVVVVSSNCCLAGGGDDDGVNVCSSLPISSENKMGDIQLTYRYYDIHL
ncbi:MAG TPA: hypothetical protein VE076_12475 [Nitrososphaeraceae archaeon]|nr:hypothetical protein [Nitrososphaeraceae archaeon]